MQKNIHRKTRREFSMEEKIRLERGRVVGGVFSDAPIPRNSDMPEVSIRLLRTDTPPVEAGETVIVSGPGFQCLRWRAFVDAGKHIAKKCVANAVRFWLSKASAT